MPPFAGGHVTDEAPAAVDETTLAEDNLRSDARAFRRCV